MAKKEHGELYKRAVAELQRSGLKAEGNAATSSIYHTTLKVVDDIEKGSINQFTLGVIKNLAWILSDGELINDVTNNPDEWKELAIDGGEVFDAGWQNVRNPKVYSHDGGRTWVRFDGEGRQNGVSLEVSGGEPDASSEA